MPSILTELLCLVIALVPIGLGVFIASMQSESPARKTKTLDQQDWRDADSVKPYGDWADEMAKTDAERNRPDETKTL